MPNKLIFLMKVDIISAKENNVSELTSLFLEICREIDSNAVPKGAANIFRKAMAEKDKFFLAKVNDENIGYIWITIQRKAHKQVCILFDMSIKQDFRNKGGDKVMLDFVKEYAKKSNCSVVHVEIDLHNKSSIQFFEKHGFKEIKKVVEFEL